MSEKEQCGGLPSEDIVHWEEAAYGDPGIDAADCCMDMTLSELGEATDEFLRVYESGLGWRVANLGLWELATAARPMFHASGWLDRSPARERFRQFIADARNRSGFQLTG